MRRLRSRYAHVIRRAWTTVVPPKPLFERINPTLMKLGLRWDRSRLPYLYRLAPLQTTRDCSPLVDPPFVRAFEARHMRDEDDVIGLAVDGEARAYPWWILDNHHVANDIVAGRPAVVSLCEMCSSGLAFDPVVDGRRLIFRATHVYMGTTAIEDRQTKSLWSTYFAQAITGPLRGTSLTLLPAQQMQWGAWRARHPDTLVLPGYLGSRRGHGSAHTLGSAQLSRDMRRMVPRWDRRLPHNALVLGVLQGREQRAYPLAALRERGGVVNDEVGGVPVVIMADLAAGSGGALAFSRIVDGRPLTYAAQPGGAVDLESGSRWSPEGVAVEGPLAGTQLTFVPSHVSEWFIWAAHFPDIQLVGNGFPHPAPEPEEESFTSEE
ncbi:MAG TPA: DUF3179 domain-containing (seleno)protein, partial [Actinomycetota bacterium]|nr:DUF3179 domain-containing (seleno)protein [Actinomycetota bacterium]